MDRLVLGLFYPLLISFAVLALAGGEEITKGKLTIRFLLALTTIVAVDVWIIIQMVSR